MLRFWKVQSIGNDFPLLKAEDIDGFALLTPEQQTSRLGELAIALCARRFSVGGDGLLVVSSTEGGVHLRMFNPDGTEDFCGNGIRAAARFSFDQGLAGASFNMTHLDRTIPITIDGEKIRTQIGVASYDPDKVPHTLMGELFGATVWTGMDGGVPLSLFGSALSTGSTHTIIHTDRLPDDETFNSVSAKVEVDPKFPQRTSVIWCRRVDPDTLEIRIWERGVGETLGCGTGSSAAAADLMRRRSKGGRVEVRNPGGTVWVEADRWDQPLTLEGAANVVFEGQVSV